MLFRNKRDDNGGNSKTEATTAGNTFGVARSSKTGGFEVPPDFDMICDDSSVESDTLPASRKLAIISVNEIRIQAKSPTICLTKIHCPTASASASASTTHSPNCRDDCSWVRRDDERGDVRTTERSKRNQARPVNPSSTDSVATPQFLGCCAITPSSLLLSRENLRQDQAMLIAPSSPCADGTFCNFELANPNFFSVPPPPPPPAKKGFSTANISQRSKGPIDLDADDGSYSSSIDSDLGIRINVSDSKLMESNSPGSLRLTADALQRHQRKALLTSVKPQKTNRRHTNGYDSWKLKRDEKLWYREQHQARDEELLDQTWKLQMQQRERAATSTTIGSSEGSCSGRPRLASDARKCSLGELSQSSWSSRLLGEEFEEDESNRCSSRHRSPSASGKNVSLGNISNSSTSSHQLLAGDGRPLRGPNEERIAASDASRQSKRGSSSRGSSCNVPPQDPTVRRIGAKTADREADRITGKKKQTVLPLPPLGLKNFFVAAEDVADLSLAPLSSLCDFALPRSNVKSQEQNVGPSRKLGVLRSLVPQSIVRKAGKKGNAQIASELLERERQRELQSRVARRRAELEEQERIQQLKTSELERQRKLEAQAAMERKQRQQDEERKKNVTDEWSHDSMLMGKMIDRDDHHDEHTGQDVSTITTATSSMAPCVICRAGQRSHIAMPCMHYSFCEECVNQMRMKSIDKCPVCCAQNVVFSLVLT